MIFFVLSNCIACLYPKQDTRNALDDIDTSRIASFLLEEHSSSKFSKHGMIKNRPITRFIPRLLVRACSPQQEKDDPCCMRNQDREDSETSREAVTTLRWWVSTLCCALRSCPVVCDSIVL